LSLRIGFDLDGVLADMDRELIRQTETIFGKAIASRLAGAPTEPPSPIAPAGQTPPAIDAGQTAQGTTEKAVPEADLSKLQMTARQQRRLWQHIGRIENFWETLEEIEPGAIARLARLAAERQWEIIFLTKRPPSVGATSQVQSQRWLTSKGFNMPSVFVVQGSRGRIASALALDFVIDDRPENCLDVVVDSRARAILVWRDGQGPLPSAAKRLGIGVVRSVGDCLDVLAQGDVAPTDKPGVLDRVMRLLGLKERAKPDDTLNSPNEF
jgi:hypothetical protein